MKLHATIATSKIRKLFFFLKRQSLSPIPPCTAQHTHIEGLQPIMKRFGDIVEEVRRKPYDLLDAAKNIFDRDFLEFNVHINDLELAVQACACLCWGVSRPCVYFDNFAYIFCNAARDPSPGFGSGLMPATSLPRKGSAFGYLCLAWKHVSAHQLCLRSATKHNLLTVQSAMCKEEEKGNTGCAGVCACVIRGHEEHGLCAAAASAIPERAAARQPPC